MLLKLNIRTHWLTFYSTYESKYAIRKALRDASLVLQPCNFPKLFCKVYIIFMNTKIFYSVPIILLKVNIRTN